MTRLCILFAAVVLSLAAFAIGWDSGREQAAAKASHERKRLCPEPSRN